MLSEFALFPHPCADKMERLSVRSNYMKNDQALTSTEFIAKYQSTLTEMESSNSQLRKREEDVGAKEPISASLIEEPQKTREQFEQSKDFALWLTDKSSTTSKLFPWDSLLFVAALPSYTSE